MSFVHFTRLLVLPGKVPQNSNSDAGRRTKFAPVKSLRFSELFLRILLSEFRFTVFFPLGCGVKS